MLAIVHDYINVRNVNEWQQSGSIELGTSWVKPREITSVELKINSAVVVLTVVPSWLKANIIEYPFSFIFRQKL